jgi:hypothetical protein
VQTCLFDLSTVGHSNHDDMASNSRTLTDAPERVRTTTCPSDRNACRRPICHMIRGRSKIPVSRSSPLNSSLRQGNTQRRIPQTTKLTGFCLVFGVMFYNFVSLYYLCKLLEFCFIHFIHCPRNSWHFFSFLF